MSYCGWTNSCTTWKPWLKPLFAWNLQGNHPKPGSKVVRNGFRPSTILTVTFSTQRRVPRGEFPRFQFQFRNSPPSSVHCTGSQGQGPSLAQSDGSSAVAQRNASNSSRSLFFLEAKNEIQKSHLLDEPPMPSGFPWEKRQPVLVG